MKAGWLSVELLDGAHHHNYSPPSSSSLAEHSNSEAIRNVTLSGKDKVSCCPWKVDSSNFSKSASYSFRLLSFHFLIFSTVFEQTYTPLLLYIELNDDHECLGGSEGFGKTKSSFLVRVSSVLKMPTSQKNIRYYEFKELSKYYLNHGRTLGF